MSVIYHLAFATDWAEAVPAGRYAVSTRSLSLAEQGFIHAATAEQVAGVHQSSYADATGLVLLTIDVSRLDVPVQWEAVPGQPKPFPHIYGSLPVSAVVSVDPYP